MEVARNPGASAFSSRHQARRAPTLIAHAIQPRHVGDGNVGPAEGTATRTRLADFDRFQANAKTPCFSHQQRFRSRFLHTDQHSIRIKYIPAPCRSSSRQCSGGHHSARTGETVRRSTAEQAYRLLDKHRNHFREWGVYVQVNVACRQRILADFRVARAIMPRLAELALLRARPDAQRSLVAPGRATHFARSARALRVETACE